MRSKEQLNETQTKMVFDDKLAAKIYSSKHLHSFNICRQVAVELLDSVGHDQHQEQHKKSDNGI
jgi:hypothetical protein